MSVFPDEEKINEFLEGKKQFKVSKEKEFSLWFRAVLRLADIIDDRFPAKGFYYYPWYGFELSKRIIGILEELLREKGHKEERYPTLIPYSVFMKEKDFFEGFQGEGYVIKETLQGRKIEEPLIVRPTSETAMYYFWSKRIRSYRDLPVKVFQTVNVFRCETKMTKPFLRVREITFFNESHTAHRTKEEAEKQIKEALEIYSKFYDSLGVPYIIVRTPEWDTFPGAEYNYDFLSVMPDGKAIELGSVINLGQKFAKAFDIKFQDEDGEWKYVWQTCYGIAERSVGVTISIHGDDLGLVLPPNVAPIQIVIVPIYYNEEQKEKVMKEVTKVYNLLKNDFRVEIDDREDKTPGWKFYYWDLKGVPLRIEIGPRDVEKSSVTIVRRDNKEKIEVLIDNLKEAVEKTLNAIFENLRDRARKWFFEKIRVVETLEDFEKYVKETLIIAPLCYTEGHAQQVKDNYEREVLGKVEYGIDLKEKGKCILCGREVDTWVAIGKTY